MVGEVDRHQVAKLLGGHSQTARTTKPIILDMDYARVTFHRFQKACIEYGVPDVDLFQTVDLWEQKNIYRVTMTIFAIGRTVRVNQKTGIFLYTARGNRRVMSSLRPRRCFDRRFLFLGFGFLFVAKRFS